MGCRPKKHFRNTGFRVVLALAALFFSSFTNAEDTIQNEIRCTGAGETYFDDGFEAGCIFENVYELKKVHVGKWILRNAQKQIVQEVMYDGNGRLDGAAYQFYPQSGKIEQETYYSSNKPTGLWSFWYENGQLKEERHYLAGKVHGLRRRWNSAGEPKGMECFISGERMRIEECNTPEFANQNEDPSNRHPSRSLASE